MSRSFKKPIIKDNNSFCQKEGHRRFRGKTKQLIKQNKFEELPVTMSEVINDYDVCDYKIFSKRKSDKRK